jgi:predicted flap endonuclease-1-like 5' DNA nuclease
MKNPPILVAVLGFFAALAGFSFIFMGFRMIGFDWFGVLGDLPAFESVGLWGWLTVITGVIWLVAALGLWALQPWARLFAMIMAGFGLIEAALAFFQFPGTGVGIAMAILPGFILWYLMTSEVKVAFGVEADPAEATSPGAAAAVAAAPVSTAEEPAPAPASAPAASGPGYPRVSVIDVEGIGSAYAEKLSAVGIVSTDQLLTTGATRKGREDLAEASGISEHLILAWVNKVDLMRVPGVGPQYSDLLELAGVDSPAELARRNAANLAETVQEVVAERPGTVRRIASEAEVAEWIEAAKTMPKVVEH